MIASAAFTDDQRSIGAELRQVGGVTYAASYGDLDAELRAARDSVGLLWQPWRAYLRVSGGERLGFLHRLLTANVEALQPGDGVASLLLDNRGKVQASLDLWAEDDAVLIGAEVTVAAAVVEGLRRYVLRSAVHIDASQLVSLAVIGPRHETVINAVGIDPAVAPVLRTARLPGGVELALPESRARDLLQSLRQMDHQSVRPIGRDCAEVLRVEAGVPAHGAELTGNELPQEARLEAAVDFEKGCYLGQETVARIHYRGHVNRVLSGLRLESFARPGATLCSDGRGVGSVTSSVSSDVHGPIGLGYVRREHADPGAVVRLEDGSGAEVNQLPFGVGPGHSSATPNT